MSFHIFWPALTVFTLGMAMIMFIILKYGDRICKARSVPIEGPAPYMRGQLVRAPSVNETIAYDDRSVDYDEKSECREIFGSSEVIDAYQMVDVHVNPSGAVEAAV